MSQRGFTLIELLVVIAIISLLSSTVFASLQNTRKKARDARRIADLREFETALELFHIQYGMYPCGDHNHATLTGYMTDSSWSDPFLDGNLKYGNASNCTAPPQTGIFSETFYPREWAQDPLNQSGVWGYVYLVPPNRQSYLLFTRLEDTPQLMQQDGGLCGNYYERGPGTGMILGTYGGIPCN